MLGWKSNLSFGKKGDIKPVYSKNGKREYKSAPYTVRQKQCEICGKLTTDGYLCKECHDFIRKKKSSNTEKESC